MRAGGRRGATIALALLVICCTAGAASAKPQGPGRHGTEFVDAVPSQGLDGSPVVKVSGTGFPPSARLALTECLAVSQGADDCDLGTLDLTITARADGSFGPVSFTVHPVINVGSRPDPVHCGTDGCSVGVGTLDAAYGGSHCLGFGGPCVAVPASTVQPSELPSPQGTSAGGTTGGVAITSSGPTAPVSGSAPDQGSNTGLVIAGVIVAIVAIAVGVAIVLRRRRGNR